MANKAIPLKEALKRLPPDIELLEYTTATGPCLIKCKHCGAEYQKDFNRVVRKRRGIFIRNCMCRGWKLATTEADFLKAIAHLPYKALDYEIMGKRCAFECKSCNTVFTTRPFDIQSGASTCPTCKQAAFAEEYKQRLAEDFPHIQMVGDYQGHRHSVLHRCTCGYEWLSKPFIGNTRIRKAGCKFCDYLPGGPRLKEVRFGKRLVLVQGYEDIALEYLQKAGVQPVQLAVRKDEGVPTIRYYWKGKERAYWPDFYYKPKNRIVEVKSLFTLLSVDFKKTCAKAQACLQQGYNFKLLLAADNEILKVPKNWYSVSRSNLCAWLCHHYPKHAPRITGLAEKNPYLDSQR